MVLFSLLGVTLTSFRLGLIIFILSGSANEFFGKALNHVGFNFNELMFFAGVRSETIKRCLLFSVMISANRL